MRDIHLIVLQHGLWGNTSHMSYIHDRLVEAHKDEAVILNVDVNESEYTYDGIDICGERLARKIQDDVQWLAKEEGKRVTRLSMVGYSLGGLIARYAIGLLGSAGVFDTIEPDFYATFATPHIGVRLPSTSVMARIFNGVSGRMVSRTGEQLQLRDAFDEQKRPLLSVLADPEEQFYRHLKRFKTRRIYANVDNDRTVPYWTAALEVKDYFQVISKLDIELDESYSSIITSFGYRDPETSQERTKRKKKRFEKQTLIKYGLYLVSPILVPVIMVIALTYIGVQGLMSRYRTSRLLRQKKSAKSTRESTPPSSDDLLKEHESTPGRHSGNTLDNTLAQTLDIVNIPKTPTESPPQQHAPHMGQHPTPTCNVIPLKKLEEKSANLLLDTTTLNMHRNLSQLSWEKVLVYIEAYNAHGSIVCRQKRFDHPGGRAVIRHFVDTLSSP